MFALQVGNAWQANYLCSQSELMYGAEDISTNLAIGLSLVTLCPKRPGNLFKDKYSLLFWSRLTLSLRCHRSLLRGLFI